MILPEEVTTQQSLPPKINEWYSQYQVLITQLQYAKQKFMTFQENWNVNNFSTFCIFSNVGLKNCFIKSISIFNIPSFDHFKSRLPNLFTASPI